MNTALSVGDMMGAYAQEAVEYAQRAFNISLDYSEGSVQRVEELLAKLHETMPKGSVNNLFKKGPSPEELDQMTRMMGGYIGEVIKRAWGGRWKLESAAFPGQQVITLEVKGGGDIWPQFKVGKQLINGSADSVWAYFQVLKQKYGR
jgi:hypothetical protein